MPAPTAPNKRPAAAPASTLPLWGVACFFGSGAAGLLYEIVWSKQLAYLLGSSIHSVATVVAAFLGGLALGARFLGVPLSRRGNGARTYALLELGVGVLGLVTLPVLRGLEPAIGQLYRGLGGEGAAFALARFGLLFALLVPPAALMGATLPVLVARFERDLVGPALARLYAVNTFGAVAGSVAGGFALLPGLGLLGTTFVAAALNIVVAIVAWLAGGPVRAGEPAPAPAPSSAPRADSLAGGAYAAFALLFAASGFGALVFQIAWIRLFGLVLGSSVYSFSGVLGVYLLGLAIGSALAGPWLRRGAGLFAFALVQLGLAASAALATHLFPRLPQQMYDLAAKSGASWGALFAGELGMVATVLFVPCVLLGAAFPIGARLLQRRDGGHAAGVAYAINTLGTIAGSLAAGFALVPAWGVQGSHLFAVALAAAIGVLALTLERGVATGARLGRLGAGAAGVVLAAALAFTAPAWDPSLMSSGPYRPAQAANLARYAQYVEGNEGVVYRASRNERVLLYREGVNASVLVGEDADGESRWLRVGGKVDASTNDMDTQVLLGLLPAALADSGARTLVIGLGSGATAAAVLAAGAGPTDVVELEQGVVDGSRFFFSEGQSPLDDPRTTLILGDARTHLLHGAGQYGLIVSEPSNPWIAGVNNLFTVDFYRHVKRRLAPGGVFCQWMQLYELSGPTFASMIASYLEVFPKGQVFCVWKSVDLLLIATDGDRPLALGRLSSPASRALLARARVSEPADLACYWAAPLASLAPVAKGATLNRDDRPVVEYRAPRDLVEVGSGQATKTANFSARVSLDSGLPAGALTAAWTSETWTEHRALGLARQGQVGNARAVVASARAAGLTALADRLDAAVGAADRRREALAVVEHAKELLATGNEEAGRGELQRAAAIDPSYGIAWTMLAERFRDAGDYVSADEALARARAAAPEPQTLIDIAMVSGIVDLSRQRWATAATHFREAQRLSPALAQAYLLEAQVRSQAGDLAGARDAVARGLAAVPNDAGLVSAQQQLAAAGK